MTDKSELREKVIEAMATALWVAGGEEYISDVMGITQPPWKYYVKEATAALDALHGIVRVVPPEAAEDEIRDFIRHAYQGMVASGDITQPKEPT